MCGLEILALHTRRHKGLFAYHKTNGIIAMKEHVNVEHKTLFANYVEHATNWFRSPLHREKIVKGPMLHQMPFLFYFFVVLTHLQKTMAKKCFMENVMLYVVKG
jgi:hypothetical protein